MSPCSLFQFTPLCERLHYTRLEYHRFVEFQFTPLCERLLNSSASTQYRFLFQFTPLCERLQLCFCSSGLKLYFNSRLSARGYQSALLTTAMASQFQFTPLCERLRDILGIMRPIKKFQFTPLCERLPRITVMRTLFRYFNSRLSARGYSKNRQYIAVFQLNFCLISLLCYIHSIIL